MKKIRATFLVHGWSETETWIVNKSQLKVLEKLCEYDVIDELFTDDDEDILDLTEED